jgi:hypothetical protein
MRLEDYDIIEEEGIGNRGKPVEPQDSTIKSIRKKINSSKYVAVLAAYLCFVGTPAILSDTLTPLLREKVPSTKELIMYEPKNLGGFLGKTIFLAGTPVRKFIRFTNNKLESYLNKK